MRLSFTALLLATAGLFGFGHQAQAQTVYALMPSTDVAGAVSLTSFDAAAPAALTRMAYITGTGGLLPVAIETRPATGQLYLLAYSNFQARLFVLNPVNSVASPVGPVLSLGLGSSPNNIGFGFDPVADQVRVVGNTANYRLDPGTGTLAATDAPLAYANTDAYAGQTPYVGAIAYSNTYNGSSATLLYGLDKSAGRLVTLNPPNAGTLRTVGPVGIVLTGGLASFDVDYNPASGSNTLYLVRSSLIGNTSEAFLYTLSPATGAATLVGPVGGALAYSLVSDIAVARSVVSATRARGGATTDVRVYPNPGAGPRHLAFTLNQAGRVAFDLFDPLGRLLSSQTYGWLPAGPHTLPWAARLSGHGLHTLRLRVDGQPQGAVLVEAAD
ncbi:DUF4394 domain-containing protein [Hymenobacter properus]|uniref:DUF4394 domain-containing protein n=1 Tax=Hymenobacter properus TaxID=2791026 RepID=A0A931BIY4_9BACT|nr:DUF4394 domain-containing protein [Hymenobacter properus]MBF9142207.1 DUF4394 domain-containing protein [Hymenobacter properus]MBR7721014.1 DUF4394 domain-containing protein [Microvirga sp. SRT04]